MSDQVHTESIAVADFSPPTAHQMNLILRLVGHPWVPFTNEVHVFVNHIRLDLMEDNAMHVLSSGKDLTETTFDLLVHLPGFRGAIDEISQTSTLFGGVILRARLLCWVLVASSRFATLVTCFLPPRASAELLVSHHGTSAASDRRHILCLARCQTESALF